MMSWGLLQPAVVAWHSTAIVAIVPNSPACGGCASLDIVQKNSCVQRMMHCSRVPGGKTQSRVLFCAAQLWMKSAADDSAE